MHGKIFANLGANSFIKISQNTIIFGFKYHTIFPLSNSYNFCSSQPCTFRHFLSVFPSINFRTLSLSNSLVEDSEPFYAHLSVYFYVYGGGHQEAVGSEKTTRSSSSSRSSCGNGNGTSVSI